MKNKLLCLVCILCLSPILSHATVTKALEVAFAFEDSGSQQLVGYKFYKDNTKVCQTTNPGASKLAGDISTNTGTFNFTLTAYYASGSESPPSPSFPFSISATTSNPPIARYTWAFGVGSQATGKTASHTFTKTGPYNTSLTVKDSIGQANSVSTPIIITSTTQTAPAPLPASAFNIEAGEVNINQNWVKVLFDNTFSQPIVVAGPATFEENEPVLGRIRNMDQKGFEVRLQEWAYQNGTHAAETFSYIVMEKGTFALNNGAKVEAGSYIGSNSFQKISLQQPYNFTPVILAQIITENVTEPVTD